MDDVINFGGKKIFQMQIAFFQIIHLAKNNWVIRASTWAKKFFAEEHFENKIEALVRLEQVSISFKALFNATDFEDAVIQGDYVVCLAIQEKDDKWQLGVSFVNQQILYASFDSFREAEREMKRIINKAEIYDAFELLGAAFVRDKIVIIKKDEKKKKIKLFFVNGDYFEIFFKDKKELEATCEEIINFSYPNEDQEG
ncbi:MAG: hypothetical protein PHR57_02345 [Patescibacteria group bacterium]|nr:hypothetical protein [Patescibacteria group bacterium]